ncbi:programmed cell death protein 5 [Nannochloropsis oceanica]
MEPAGEIDLPPGFTPAGGGGMGGMIGGGGMSQEAAEAQKAKQAEMEERRQFMLDQILLPEAKERLARIAIVRKEKARAVEDMLLQAATSGRLGGKVTEEQLIQMLEQVSSQVEKKATKVTIQRRRYLDEDDDDNDDDLL